MDMDPGGAGFLEHAGAYIHDSAVEVVYAQRSAAGIAHVHVLVADAERGDESGVWDGEAYRDV